MEKRKFYDIVEKKLHITDDYEVRTKNGRRFAVARIDGKKLYSMMGKA